MLELHVEYSWFQLSANITIILLSLYYAHQGQKLLNGGDEVGFCEHMGANIYIKINLQNMGE